MTDEKCRCIRLGMEVQEAIGRIEYHVSMVRETGGSIKGRLEDEGSMAALRRGLAGIDDKCLKLPVRVSQIVAEMEDSLKWPRPDEDEIGREVAELKALFRSVIEEACER